MFTNKWSNSRHSHSHHDGQSYQNCPQNIVDQQRPFCKIILDGIPYDFKAHVELKSEGAVDGEGDQDFYRLSQTTKIIEI